MKRLLLAATLAAAIAPAFAADVGVSVSIGQPGFYGHIDIGNVPKPQLIYPQPVVIQPVPVGVTYQPMYLYVPPGHAKHWGKHCHRYNACGRPVYFVQDNWYNNVYVPHYRQHGHDRGEQRGGDRHHDHGSERHHQGDDHGEHHGNGRGRGHGNGHGHD